MWLYDCKNDLSAFILKTLMWWKVCWNPCGMQINSNCPIISGTIQESWFQINSNTSWVLEPKIMSDIWVIWNLVTLNLNHLRLPQCSIATVSIMVTQHYQIQALAVRDTVHSPPPSARRERSCFLLRHLPHLLIIPFWTASFGSDWTSLTSLKFSEQFLHLWKLSK